MRIDAVSPKCRGRCSLIDGMHGTVEKLAIGMDERPVLAAAIPALESALRAADDDTTKYLQPAFSGTWTGPCPGHENATELLEKAGRY